MRLITEWNESLVWTLACGSPGSAWAYTQSLTGESAGMVRRTAAPAETKQVAAAVQPQASAFTAVKRWIGGVWQRFDQWSWQQQLRRDEAYLAQSQNLFDLEARMRRLDGDVFFRARGLR